MAVHNIISDNTNMLSYGSGDRNTWWGFYVTDRNEANNEVIDRYSNDRRYYGSRSEGYRIRHEHRALISEVMVGRQYRPECLPRPLQSHALRTENQLIQEQLPHGQGHATNPTTNGCTK